MCYFSRNPNWDIIKELKLNCDDEKKDEYKTPWEYITGEESGGKDVNVLSWERGSLWTSFHINNCISLSLLMAVQLSIVHVLGFGTPSNSGKYHSFYSLIVRSGKNLNVLFAFKVKHFFFSIFYCFFHYHLVPLLPFLPTTITTLLSTSMSSFSFLLNPSTPPPHLLSSCYLWVCLYFACSSQRKTNNLWFHSCVESNKQTELTFFRIYFIGYYSFTSDELLVHDLSLLLCGSLYMIFSKAHSQIGQSFFIVSVLLLAMLWKSFSTPRLMTLTNWRFQRYHILNSY